MSSVSMQTEKSRRDEYSFRREDEDFGKDDDDDENDGAMRTGKMKRRREKRQK